MTKEEIAQAQEVIDAVQNGAPLDKPLQAAFPTSPSAAPAGEPQTKIWKCDGCGRTYYELTPLEDCECGCTSFTCIKINVLAEDAVPRTPEPDHIYVRGDALCPMCIIDKKPYSQEDLKAIHPAAAHWKQKALDAEAVTAHKDQEIAQLKERLAIATNQALGKVKSDRKAQSSAKNGKLGGRPKSKPNQSQNTL